MFGLGWSEILLIMVVVLLLFGARRLPELGRSLGKALSSFKRGLNEIESEVEDSAKLESKNKDSAATPTENKPDSSPTNTPRAG